MGLHFKEIYNYHEYNLLLRNCTTFIDNILVNASPRWTSSRCMTPYAELNYLRMMDVAGQVKKEVVHQPKEELSASEYAYFLANLSNA